MTNKLVQQIIFGALFILNYIPTLTWMWDRWWARDSYYSHGILVPVVTIYLIWQQMDDLKKLPVAASRWGVVLIAGGLFIHLLSAFFRIYFSSGFSMIIVLAGFILHFYGKAVMKKIWFPVFFLVFMIPIPLATITKISFKLKLFAAEIATMCLNNMRIPAIQQGSTIRMAHTQVIVDDVCSGLRSLISLTALGSIFAYWMKSGVFKKILLFLSTIPIAIITNVFRVIFLSVISEVWGAQYATGFVHDLSGFLVFALAFVLLFAVGKILE